MFSTLFPVLFVQEIDAKKQCIPLQNVGLQHVQVLSCHLGLKSFDSELVEVSPPKNHLTP